jgi:hypothetical protein
LKEMVAQDRYPSISDLDGDQARCVDTLKSAFLFEKESDHHQVAKEIRKAGGLEKQDRLFDLLVKLGVWGRNVNLDLLRNRIEVEFPETVKDYAENLVKEAFYSSPKPSNGINARI